MASFNRGFGGGGRRRRMRFQAIKMNYAFVVSDKGSQRLQEYTTGLNGIFNIRGQQQNPNATAGAIGYGGTSQDLNIYGEQQTMLVLWSDITPPKQVSGIYTGIKWQVHIVPEPDRPTQGQTGAQAAWLISTTVPINASVGASILKHDPGVLPNAPGFLGSFDGGFSKIGVPEENVILSTQGAIQACSRWITSHNFVGETRTVRNMNATDTYSIMMWTGNATQLPVRVSGQIVYFLGQS